MSSKLYFACLAWVVLAEPASAALDIWAPRQHCPAYVQPGSNFTAEVRGASSLPASGWSASVSNDLKSWNCSVVASTYGSIHQGTENGWRLAIGVPADAPPELLGLVIAHASGGTTHRQRAVRVVRSFEESFYILQLTDQHVTSQKAVVPGGNASATYGNGSTDAMRWAAPVINLMNPRFVLMTGDNNQIYNSATSWCGMPEAQRRVQIYLDALGSYSVSTVCVDGNHDVGYSNYTNSQEVRANYEAMVGARVFSFRMGSFYVLGNEFTYDQYMPWVRSDYAAAWADPSVKYRLIVQHYPDNWVAVAYATNPCNLMLVGHSHTTQTSQTTPYPIQVSGTSQDYQKASFYSFERGASAWTCAQATNHAEGLNVWRLFGDWGSNPVVSATFTRTNNGTQTSNTVSVVNKLGQDFYHGRVRFLMAHGAYAASGGEIEAQYDYNSGANTAVLLKMNLRKHTTTAVTIVLAGSAAIPRFSAPALSGGSLILRGSHGPPGGAYHVLSSTNMMLPLAGWARLSTNLFDVSGNFYCSNRLNASTSQQFFRLQMP